MIKVGNETKKQLIELFQTKNIALEGNIVKLFDHEGDPDFEKYLKECSDKDKENRRKRLEITKQVQQQNKDLSGLNEENQRMMSELQDTLKNVEESKITFEVQNRELNEWKQDNLRLTEELQNEMVKSEQARLEAEKAKEVALTDLDLLQKRTQTELIGTIVKVALVVILSVGVITTGLYVTAMFTGKDTQIIGSTWSNMFGILLTNAFSIIGTIMGVKYASEKKEE
jgi:predicted RNase H-like nuclease (RuvC/YqgF family)